MIPSRIPTVLLALTLATSAPAALEVTEAPDPNVTPTTQIKVNLQMIPGSSVTIASLDRAMGADDGFFGRFDFNAQQTYFFRSTDTPPAPATATSVFTYYSNNDGVETYNFGGQSGSDNWIYITQNTGTKAWAQLDINQTTVTVLRYVHDPENPLADFTLAQALAAVNGPTSAPRDIQIRSVDFTTAIIELKNYGPGTIDLSGWQFCSHDVDQIRRYSSAGGLNGISIDSGQSFFIHFNNDAPGGNSINRSTVGSFALPLTRNLYAIGLYFSPVSFINGNTIADHLQWSRGGTDNNTDDERSDEAQSGGVWTNQSTWIVTSEKTEQIILTDTANGILHGPDDYLRLPDFGITSFTYLPASGDVIVEFPEVNNLVVDLQKAVDLATDTWNTEVTTSTNTAFLDDETDDEALYRIVPRIP